MRILLSSILCASALSVSAGEVKYRISYDQLTDPKTILEGNVGTSILYETDKGTYFGGTVYSASKGQAGGLFIGGYEVGQKISLGKQLFLDGAIFFGGGGGAAIVPGDGMLIRPRLSLGTKFKAYELSGGLSYMRVTGSKISSPVWEMALTRNVDWLLGDRHSNCENCSGLTNGEYVTISSIGASFKNYTPLTDLAAGKRSGEKLTNFQLAGMQINFDMDKMWGEGFKSFISAHGAMASDGEGYAEFQVGARYEIEMDHSFIPDIYGEASVGFGGGGDVHTAGGTIISVNAGAKWDIFSSAELDTSIGYTRGLSGDFHAIASSAKLNYILGDKKTSRFDATRFDITTGYTIIPEHANMRYPHETDTGFLGLTDFKADLFLNDHLFVTGHALSVTEGGAGGFAIGYVGAGLQTQLSEKIAVGGELLVGAGAGGAINVEGGLLAAAQLDVDYRLNDDISLTSNVGWTKAVKGGLNGAMIGAGLKFHVSTFD